MRRPQGQNRLRQVLFMGFQILIATALSASVAVSSQAQDEEAEEPVFFECSLETGDCTCEINSVVGVGGCAQLQGTQCWEELIMCDFTKLPTTCTCTLKGEDGEPFEPDMEDLDDE